MMKLGSALRMALVAVVALAVTGCCVLPPHGWGHGSRGHGYGRHFDSSAQPTTPYWRAPAREPIMSN